MAARRDKRLDNVVSVPSGTSLLSREQQLEVINEAMHKVMYDENHIVKRVLMNDDYKFNSQPE